MYVIKVLVRLDDSSFDSLPIAKYTRLDDGDREPVVLQWKTDTEALQWSADNMPGMVCLIEDNDEIDDQPYTCSGCNTAPCDCSEEQLGNTGSLR
jgi:hypothetical protein